MSAPPSVVYDCNVFVQALININGPAGRCVQHALNKDVSLVLSDTAISEIRRAPSKRTPSRLGVTVERTELLIRDLLKVAMVVPNVGVEFNLARDPDDAHYVNLALAAGARHIISRDKDLISLMDMNRIEGVEFQRRYPTLRIIDPVEFLREVVSKMS